MNVSPLYQVLDAVTWQHPLLLDVAIGLAMGVAIGLALSSVRDRLG
jgi:hypothetical protein